MGFALESRACDGYLFVKASGENGIDAVREFFGAARRLAEEGGFRKILIDGKDVGDDKKHFDRYLVGIAVAETFGSSYRVAILRRREHINKLGENTAVNRGADFFVCEDEEEALSWLMRS